jgi:hypothetical protein
MKMKKEERRKGREGKKGEKDANGLLCMGIAG